MATAPRSRVGSASYDNRNAGSGKLVSAPVAVVGASNGAMPVYGYTLAGGSAAAPIGSITPGGAGPRRRRRQQGLRRQHDVGGGARASSPGWSPATASAA